MKRKAKEGQESETVTVSFHASRPLVRRFAEACAQRGTKQKYVGEHLLEEFLVQPDNWLGKWTGRKVE